MKNKDVQNLIIKKYIDKSKFVKVIVWIIAVIKILIKENFYIK